MTDRPGAVGHAVQVAKCSRISLTAVGGWGCIVIGRIGLVRASRVGYLRVCWGIVGVSIIGTLAVPSRFAVLGRRALVGSCLGIDRSVIDRRRRENPVVTCGCRFLNVHDVVYGQEYCRDEYQYDNHHGWANARIQSYHSYALELASSLSQPR